MASNLSNITGAKLQLFFEFEEEPVDSGRDVPQDNGGSGEGAEDGGLEDGAEDDIQVHGRRKPLVPSPIERKQEDDNHHGLQLPAGEDIDLEAPPQIAVQQREIEQIGAEGGIGGAVDAHGADKEVVENDGRSFSWP